MELFFESKFEGVPGLTAKDTALTQHKVKTIAAPIVKTIGAAGTLINEIALSLTVRPGLPLLTKLVVLDLPSACLTNVHINCLYGTSSGVVSPILVIDLAYRVPRQNLLDLRRIQ